MFLVFTKLTTWIHLGPNTPAPTPTPRTSKADWCRPGVSPTQEAKTLRLEVQDLLGLHSKFKANLGKLGSSCLKISTKEARAKHLLSEQRGPRLNLRIFFNEPLLGWSQGIENHNEDATPST